MFNVIIELFSNEIIYKFKVWNALFSIIEIIIVNISNLFVQRMKYQRKIVDVTNFVVVKIKVYYDVKHTSIFFEKYEYVYLWLNKRYKLSKKFNSKLSQQCCEFFKILKRVERLVYKLKLSLIWLVYSVIFIVQLKSVFVDFDLYQRLKFHYFDSIEIKERINQYWFYEIKRLINKKIRKYNKTLITQYLVKWINYEFEFDE